MQFKENDLVVATIDGQRFYGRFDHYLPNGKKAIIILNDSSIPKLIDVVNDKIEEDKRRIIHNILKKL